MIRRCTEADIPAIETIVNDAAAAGGLARARADAAQAVRPLDPGRPRMPPQPDAHGRDDERSCGDPRVGEVPASGARHRGACPRPPRSTGFTSIGHYKGEPTIRPPLRFLPMSIQFDGAVMFRDTTLTRIPVFAVYLSPSV